MRSKAASVFIGIICIVALAAAGYSVADRLHPNNAISSWVKNLAGTPASTSSTSNAPSANSITTSAGATGSATDAALQGWYRQRLNASQQAVYDTLYAGISADQTAIAVGDAAFDDADAAYEYLYLDHPEFFWISNSYTYLSNPVTGNVMTMMPTWNMDASTRDADRPRIEAAADQMIARTSSASTYDKVKAAYEYVIAQTDYDNTLSLSNDWNIAGVLLDGTAVCGGYSAAFEYLLQRQGVACTAITGPSQGTYHEWNLVVIDGVNTLVDCTYGDPSFASGSIGHDNLSYDYLCVTDADLQQTHVADQAAMLPDCTDDTYSYYRQNGGYFETYERSEVLAFLLQKAQPGRNTAIKMGSDEAFSQMTADLLDTSVLANAINMQLGSESFSYAADDVMRTVTFYWD